MNEALTMRFGMVGHQQARAALDGITASTKRLGDAAREAGGKTATSAANTRTAAAANDRMTRSQNRLSGATKKLIALVGIGGAAYATKQLAAASLDAASGLAVANSAAEQVFGGQQNVVKAWAGGAADSLGLARDQAIVAAQQFSVFAKNAGFSEKGVAGFSRGLVSVAADLGAFFDTTTEEASAAIRSGLSGEMEPLRRYSIFLSEAAVSAKAFEMGLVKAAKSPRLIAKASQDARDAQAAYSKAVVAHGKDSREAVDAGAKMQKAQDALAKATKGSLPALTEQQKILARQRVVIDSLGDARGQFAREGDQQGAQMQKYRANLRNVQAELGGRLLPTFLASVKAANTFLRGMQEGTGAGGAFAKTTQRVGAAVGVVSGFLWKHRDAITVVTAGVLAGVAAYKAILIITTVAKGVMVLTRAFQWYYAALKAGTAAQLVFNSAMVANPIGLVVAAVIGLGVALVVAYKKSEKFRSVVHGVISFVKDHWKGLLILFGGPFGAAIVGVVKHFSKIKNAFKAVIDWVKNAWNGLVEKLNAGINLANKAPGVSIATIPTIGGDASAPRYTTRQVERDTNRFVDEQLGRVPVASAKPRGRSREQITVRSTIDGREVGRATIQDDKRRRARGR